MNAKQRRDYWIRVERLRAKLDSKYSSLFKAAIEKDLKQVARDVENDGPQGAMSKMGAYAWNESMMTIMERLYREAAVLFGNAAYRSARVMSQKDSNPFGINSEVITQLVEFLVLYGFYLVAEMTQTTKAKLQDVINKAISEGKSTKEIADIIRQDDTLGYSAMRAMRIARTEVMRASNYALMKGVEQHGFVVDKMWIAVKDSRTRRIPRNSYDHVEMDGKIVEYDEPFLSIGKKGDTVVAQYPGDPNAPAGFTVNCRCTIGFVPRRDENGRLIMKR